MIGTMLHRQAARHSVVPALSPRAPAGTAVRHQKGARVRTARLLRSASASDAAHNEVLSSKVYDDAAITVEVSYAI